MKIWLDTTNLEMIQQAVNLGVLYGITTNPGILAKTGKPMNQVLQDLLDRQDGPVTVQVIANDLPQMVDQGKALYDFSDRIIVKIPVTQVGLEAILQLTQSGIPVMATVVFEPYQAMMASLAGAHFVAPYVGQIEKNGKNPWEILEAMMVIFQKYQMPTEILAASISSTEQINKCAVLGVPHITLKDDAFNQLIANLPLTQERVEHFENLWKQSKLTFL